MDIGELMQQQTRLWFEQDKIRQDLAISEMFSYEKLGLRKKSERRFAIRRREVLLKKLADVNQEYMQKIKQKYGWDKIKF